MQFDPGLEYQPNRGDHGREGNSWLLLCSALTDGPYSYIWNNNNNNSESTSHPITERSKKKNADGVRFDWPLQLSFEYHPISLSRFCLSRKFYVLVPPSLCFSEPSEV